jgi:hypothetical protein
MSGGASVKTLVINHLVSVDKARRGLRTTLFFACAVLLLAHMLPAQDTKASKIPDGEAQFTAEQLEDYYLVYKNPDVRYLRTVFDAYLNNPGGTEEERQQLQKWNKDYFRSKFIVMSRDASPFGGALITILFQDRPDKIFVAWVYPEGSNKELALRRFEVGHFSDEDVKRTRVRYKKLIEDKVHAM